VLEGDLLTRTAAVARALGRLPYRLTQVPFQLFDDTVIPALFDDAAPARLAYEWVLIRPHHPGSGATARIWPDARQPQQSTW
jgi:hypothetical protein